jgi:DNA polymerase-3 subunit alpha
VEAIIQERDAKGHFEDIFDFSKRLAARSVNKKTFECLALSGAFDCFAGVHRRQYVYAKEGDISLIEKAVKFAIKTQQDEASAQASLFGGGSGTVMPKPRIEMVEPFTEIEKLNLEKEVVGIYISGHPLDNFRFEIDTFCNTSCSALNELESMQGREVKLGAVVSSVEHRTTKTGRPFGKFSLEDYGGNCSVVLFGDDYLKFRNFMNQGWFLYVDGVVMRNTWGQQNLEFKIRHIELLNDIATKRVHGLALRVPVPSITHEFVDTLDKLCKSNAGTGALHLYLKSESESIQAEVRARSAQIKATNDFIKDLKKIGEVGVITDKKDVRWLAEENKTKLAAVELGTNSSTFVLEAVDLES